MIDENEPPLSRVEAMWRHTPFVEPAAEAEQPVEVPVESASVVERGSPEAMA